MPGYPVLRSTYRGLRSAYHSVKRVGCSDQGWARLVMDQHTRNLVAGISPETRKTLEISGDNWSKVQFKSYRKIDYPDFDICEAALEEAFDLILAEQVFEHLLWPYRAGRNVYKMLNPGGYFLCTTPFLIRVHNVPTDCSRWTETGIKYLLAECGFPIERIRTGSWGNRACVRGNFLEWKWYRPGFHSLKNEPDFPVVIWALAQK
jgi:SAM-dependent methyltransferase